MLNSALTQQRYDRMTIALHWIIALIIVLQWAGAHMIDWFPKGSCRVDARSVHIICGVFLTFALVYRIYWRSAKGVHFSLQTRSAQERLAKFVHYALYVLLTVVLGFGIFNTWIRGDDIFGLFHIPKFGAYDALSRHSIANQIVGWHRLTSNALLVLGGGHAVVALVHHYLLKDDILRRMLPR